MSRSAASGTFVATEIHEGTKAEPRRPRRAPLLEGCRLWPDSYDKPNPLHTLEERVLLPHVPALRGKVVLDVACGTGQWLRKLLGRGARAGFGVDLSPEMLAQAARNSLAGRLVRADCGALPLQSQTADVIICSLAIGHLPEPGKLAKELARIARPGADVYVSNFRPAAHARGWQRTFRHGDELIEAPSCAHSLDSVRREFESAGFQVVHCEELHLGEPEGPIFAWRGKADFLAAASETPALYVFHIRARQRLRLEVA